MWLIFGDLIADLEPHKREDTTGERKSEEVADIQAQEVGIRALRWHEDDQNSTFISSFKVFKEFFMSFFIIT